MIVIAFIGIIVGLYLSVYVLHNLILLSAHFLVKETGTSVKKQKTRFAVIIPAHNEELFLPRLLKSLKEQDYPSELFKAVVVADNCTDNTARIGSENGALTLERRDYENRGKGQAIKWALENIDIGEYDAVFIIDADCAATNGTIKVLDGMLQNGASVIQCYNGVINPDQSWFTRLLDVSRTVENEIYSPARQKLGLSSHLVGTGMCFSTRVLSRYGWDAFTVGEDWEYYAKLIMEGETVAYANKARVYHQESSSLRQATSQRMRWSSGRFLIARKYGFNLFLRGLKAGSLRKIDASLPLLLPNPSLGMNMSAFMFCLSLLTPHLPFKRILLVWFACLMLIQLSIFMIGIAYTRNRFKNFLSIFIAPLFLVWKMGIDILSILGIGRKKWVRTERRL